MERPAFVRISEEVRQRNSHHHGQSRPDTCRSHFKSHSQRHFFTLKPFDDNLGNSDSRNLDTHTEDGISQCGKSHLGLEAEKHGAFGEGSRNGIVFQSTAEHHQQTCPHSGKTDTHLIQNDTAEDQHQQEYVKPAVCTCEETVIKAIP